MAKNLNKCRVLITGGAGYLGGRIGDFLSQSGYDVYLGSRNSFSQNILTSCSKVVTNWQDSDLKFCNGFDVILHAAGMNAKSSSEHHEEALRVNGKLTEKLIEKSSKYGCKRFFFLSTVHVYKSPLIGTFDEESKTSNIHPYASSQSYGEMALIKALKNKSIAGAVLRLSNCFGYPANTSNECWNLVLNEFIRSAFLYGKISINGNCYSKRDFLPITALNGILLQILEKQEPIPEIINISSGKSRNLLEVAINVSDIVSRHTGKKVKVIKNTASEKETTLTIKNAALEKMNIFPREDFELEIRSMLDYLKSCK